MQIEHQEMLWETLSGFSPWTSICKNRPSDFYWNLKHSNSSSVNHVCFQPAARTNASSWLTVEESTNWHRPWLSVWATNRVGFVAVALWCVCINQVVSVLLSESLCLWYHPYTIYDQNSINSVLLLYDMALFISCLSNNTEMQYYREELVCLLALFIYLNLLN